MTAAAVDLSDLSLWCNGFPDDLFAELRRSSPLFRHELTPGVAQTVHRDFWMATKHRHAVRLHRDTESFTAADGPLIQPVAMFSSFPTIITLDPPELNRRRKLISNAFNPRAIAKLEEGIRARAARMIDDLLAAGGGDWIEDVADALPMSVIGDIIGIPDEDRPRIFGNFDQILKALAPEAHPSGRVELDLFASVFRYAMELTAEKRRNPTDDIWSTLATAVITGEDGERFSLPENELEFFFFVLAFAGSDTTKNALAIGLQAFVRNPQQIERYRAQEALRPGAVEEVLRWASPVAYWTRTAKVDVEMDGQRIAKGERVVSMLRSANRDEEVFDSPFVFDIGRQPNPHVAFGGGGPHHCLGAMLARAELRAVFDELLLRCDDIEIGPAKAAHPNLTTNMSIYDEMAISLRERR
ncbi:MULTISPECIES: cytochrome P450 [Mycobacterium]|uniref:Putative cytochrome P450 124 n=1 Tax=Mycobacterium indicus pranii (strain DSM 45239 / MTCC 9506) TaxID=1232724 RepID=J9W9E1_MYCIP|nr:MULTISPECIES: cytochrome P450 [Mycobacterium]AFS13610.1 Putative cytochrome P450 124 [Mycobacterium intracellulare subsp. intracellulare MTCC 9506]WSE50071.1 cytochrome P450 [Mycobacterium sp. 2-64]BCO51183.1 cytochrome P450 [Mycobacterium paraintracellulare]BCO88369.1 cytochrome P450 [Mycobacterium paraintracellulare]